MCTDSALETTERRTTRRERLESHAVSADRGAAVKVDLWTGQWQQSMLPSGCIGWRMATTAVASETAVEASAIEAIAMVAATTRRRVRAGVVFVIVMVLARWG
jgi:hypothetical protein